MGNLINELRARAKTLGFSALWVTDASPFAAWAQVMRARGDRFGASLEADPRAILPSAKRVVVLAYPYRDVPGPLFPLVAVSPYYLASHKAYRALPALADWLREQGWQAVARPPLPAKPAALRAGAGLYGRNGLILTEKHGSSVALALLLTDAELPLEVQTGPETGIETELGVSSAPECLCCTACVLACPVDALDGTSVVDTSRCLRAHMFSDAPVPAAYRALMGNRLLGCDRCQRVCPCNVRARENAPPAETLRLELRALLGDDASRREALRLIEEKVGANYARLHRVLAQAALLAGNSGDARYLPVLLPLCNSKNASLREHAFWASEKLTRRRG